MRIISMEAQYGILTKEEDCGKVFGKAPTIFQIECSTTEEHDKVMSMIEELL